MTVYDMILGIIGDEWITTDAIVKLLRERGATPHKGTLSRALAKARRHGLTECRYAPNGPDGLHEHRTKKGLT